MECVGIECYQGGTALLLFVRITDFKLEFKLKPTLESGGGGAMTKVKRVTKIKG